MSKYKITFTTYEEYEIEADSEKEALNEAEIQLENDRRSPVANTAYDSIEIEELS